MSPLNQGKIVLFGLVGFAAFYWFFFREETNR